MRAQMPISSPGFQEAAHSSQQGWPRVGRSKPTPEKLSQNKAAEIKIQALQEQTSMKGYGPSVHSILLPGCSGICLRLFLTTLAASRSEIPSPVNVQVPGNAAPPKGTQAASHLHSICSDCLQHG